MEEKLNLNKKTFSKNQYERVIDTSFSQLIKSTQTYAPPSPSDILNSNDGFFQTYNQIFLQIPKHGEENSYEYLIKQSTEYVGSDAVNSDIQALIEEINLLQQQNLEINQQLLNFQISSSL